MKDNLTVDAAGLKKSLVGMGIGGLQESRVLGEVYFMLSLKCNLSCKVCAWWGSKGPCRNRDFMKNFRPALTLEELVRFADEISLFRPKTVSFSGGEPLLCELWYPLARYFRQKQIKVSLTTNGVLLADNLGKIKEAVDEINLSLGGPPSILSVIRENSSSHFRKIMRGLEAITELKRKGGGPSLRILYTISDLSYAHMEELIKFMESSRILIDHYKFQHLMFIGPDTLKRQKKVFWKKLGIKDLSLWRGYAYCPSRFDFDRFREEIGKVAGYDNVSFSPALSAGELEAYYRDNKGALRYSRHCTAPWHQLNIMPDGRLYVCHDYFIGNIKEGSFNDIWNGPRARKMRLYLSQRLFPACKGCFYHYCDRAK